MKLVRQHILKLAAFIVVVGIAFWLTYIAQENTIFRTLVSDYGYVGIFIVSLISGFNLILPIPAVSFLPLYLEAGLNIWITLGIITLGMTAADSFAYIIGRFGKEIATEMHENRIFKKLDRWKQQHTYLPIVILFIYASLAPLPNELLVIPIGFIGYAYKKVLPALLLGNIIFNILTAFGVLHIFELIM
jgi:membrane protein YqaA with SNARE-associated domain